MFQAMGSCSPIKDFYNFFLSGGNENLGVVYGNLRGNLSARLPLEELRSKGIENDVIGSVSFEFTVDQKRIFILLFNKGNCRICGGFPTEVTLSHDKRSYETFFQKCLDKFEDLTNLKFSRANITCLNGQFRIDTEMKNVMDLDHFVRQHKTKFAVVKPPNLDNPGRRGAYKLYLVKGRNTHIAVDYKGVAQVFACRSFDELFQCFAMFECLVPKIN